jgi:hypothetical protein
VGRRWVCGERGVEGVFLVEAKFPDVQSVVAAVGDDAAMR